MPHWQISGIILIPTPNLGLLSVKDCLEVYGLDLSKGFGVKINHAREFSEATHAVHHLQ